jgi:cystathionine beta-lyase
MTDDETGDHLAPETILTHLGRSPFRYHGFVNTPVFRGSTVLFETLDALEAPGKEYDYGRPHNPTGRAVEAVITELEGAAGTVLAPSGLSAITLALTATVRAGEDVLITDSAYGPTRRFASETLRDMGISARFYDPRIGADIASLMLPNTTAVFVESPGSLTFEIQDLPAIAGAAKARGATVIVDNSWATPLFHKPLALGADIVVHAGTKMFVGHSDAMFGTASANAALMPRLARTHLNLGLCASPDDSYLAARGLRTLAIRMKEHRDRALEIARWLHAQPDVLEVLHPALETHPDHAVFARDFSGSGSLFAFVLPPAPREAVAAMLDGLGVFGMGYSWGGYESLFLPIHPERIRTAVPWTRGGNAFRLHIGFEDVEDLKSDLDDALTRYRAAR